jgi:hypothetical protein
MRIFMNNLAYIMDIWGRKGSQSLTLSINLYSILHDVMGCIVFGVSSHQFHTRFQERQF